MADSSVAVTAGAGTNIDTYTVPNGDHRQVVIVGDHGFFLGYMATFRTPGRAGTTGQKLAAIHNATGSTVAVDLHKVTVDLVQTAVIAVTVISPIIRMWKFTAVPTLGTAGTKVAGNSARAADSASVTVWQDASADGTNSASALAVTLPAGTVVTQEFAPRLITAAGYEMSDRVELLAEDAALVTLNALEGLCVFLDYTVAAANPITNFWTATMRWETYTP